MTESRFRNKIYQYYKKHGLECYLIHSSTEHGVDILIKQRDIFSEDRYIGLSVKVGNIKCSRGVNHSLATIIHQMIIASHYKFPELDEHNLDAVYLVTNGSISPEAMKQIRSVRHPYRDFYFIQGVIINRLLNMPDVQNSAFGGETVRQ